MTSLLNALNSGKTSLLTNQKSIEIVGNNIANVNTEGYSRQRAELMQIPAVNFGDFFIGQGVRFPTSAAITASSSAGNCRVNPSISAWKQENPDL